MLDGKFNNAVLVVAHADDECLWFGGLLARYGPKFTVICCSVPAHDPIRADKFHNACAVFGASSATLPYSEIEPLRLDRLFLDPFDLIVTHGPGGEYGHRQHKEVSAHIAARWPDAIGSAYGAQSRDLVLKLSDDEWQKKLTALRCYDHTSRTDRKPKWEALIDAYASRFDLRAEPYRRLSDTLAHAGQGARHSVA